jgi:hypothetical protein
MMVTHQLLLTGIRTICLPKTGYLKRVRKFYMKLIVDGEVKRMKIAPRAEL